MLPSGPGKTPTYLRHKKNGRVFPYHPELAKLGDDVEPFEFPTKVVPKEEPAKAVAAPGAVTSAEPKPDRAASARAALAKAREARKNPEPELPLADEAPTGE